MSKINLMDVDFIIPVRIDTVDRIENLRATVEYLANRFHTNIYVLEASKYNNHIVENVLPKDVSYSFHEDWDPIFHRTKYLNVLAKKGIAKYVAIWDADIIISEQQIFDAVERLRNNTADVAFPYDGHFYDTTGIIRTVFLESHDFSVLSENIDKMPLPYGSDMGGGAIIIRRDRYNEAGGEDEAFYGWGPEDWNRIEKWKTLDYRIDKVDGPLFHLSHPRDLNGRLHSKWQKRQAFNTLRKCQYGNIEDIEDNITPIKGMSISNIEKLHIGCGNCLLDSWLNTDINLHSENIVYLDITKPFPFSDNSFKYVFAEHVCEHVTFNEFVSALREIMRVLQPGGIFRMAIPSIEFLLDICSNPHKENNSQYVDWSIRNFASQDLSAFSFEQKDLAILTLNNFMRNWGHQFIYSIPMLERMLRETGYDDVKRCKVGESTHTELRNLERHDTQIPAWANKLETIVFEATKSL